MVQAQVLGIEARLITFSRVGTYLLEILTDLALYNSTLFLPRRRN